MLVCQRVNGRKEQYRCCRDSEVKAIKERHSDHSVNKLTQRGPQATKRVFFGKQQGVFDLQHMRV